MCCTRTAFIIHTTNASISPARLKWNRAAPFHDVASTGYTNAKRPLVYGRKLARNLQCSFYYLLCIARAYRYLALATSRKALFYWEMNPPSGGYPSRLLQLLYLLFILLCLHMVKRRIHIMNKILFSNKNLSCLSSSLYRFISRISKNLSQTEWIK